MATLIAFAPVREKIILAEFIAEFRSETPKKPPKYSPK